MARPQLSAESRFVLGKKVAQLRRDGRLPGVVYGAGRDSEPISFDQHEFELLHRQTGRNAVLDLTLSGQRRGQPVMLHAIQEHPITRRAIHVDLLAVNLQEEITVDVPLAVVGEAPAVDKMGGVLLHLHESVSVRAKPDDLPSSLELDVSALDSFESVVHASDLTIPANVTLVTDPTEPLARVQPPRIEEEARPEEEGGLETAEGEAPASATEAGSSGSAEREAEESTES